MKITARCHPALEALLPKPVPAGQMLPDWLRDMPDEVAAPSLGGESIRTLKHCAPMIDALRLGVILRCPADLHVEGGMLSWDWEPPILTDSLLSRSPVGLHVPEQASGAPFDIGPDLIIKFLNFWTLEAEPGWSLLFHHPAGYPDLPFTTLSGVVDCDLFKHGFVHFPALLKPSFEGTIARGTPVAQVVAVQKSQALEIGIMDAAQIAQTKGVQVELNTEPGVYRKKYRR